MVTDSDSLLVVDYYHRPGELDPARWVLCGETRDEFARPVRVACRRWLMATGWRMEYSHANRSEYWRHQATGVTIRLSDHAVPCIGSDRVGNPDSWAMRPWFDFSDCGLRSLSPLPERAIKVFQHWVRGQLRRNWDRWAQRVRERHARVVARMRRKTVCQAV